MIQIEHIGRDPSQRVRNQAHTIVGIINRLVFGGTLLEHVQRIEVYHKRDLPPGERRVSWLTDGVRGMYNPTTKTARVCLRNFYGSFLWGIAHDLTHIHDLVTGNLIIQGAQSVCWMNREYTDVKPWQPYVSRAKRANYKEFGGIFRPVIEAADQYVPWEVKPSVMAEVALMELRGLAGGYRVNQEVRNANG